MSFNFDSLSPADFEDLSRDLLGRELNVRFEAFGPGPDGGVDGRHANTGAKTILQSKHYRLSNFDALVRIMRRERRSIDALAPDRYLLTTSRPLTPNNKDRLEKVIGPSLRTQADVFGLEDINAMLRKYPEVQKSHVKLWLSGIGVLERVLHAAAHNFMRITHDDIMRKFKVYAENPSFRASRDILKKSHVLIISGPPGVGKTTLAEMLCYAYLGEDWDLVAIRSLGDAFAHIDDTKRQVFFFDDFLGRIALDARALSNQDSDLARFISRIRRSTNARFILTTRAYIYEEARLQSEALSSSKLKLSDYVLDVGIYTRRIRARILYNHLVFSEVPDLHIQALFKTDTIKKIVDHKNYNPRIVQALTETEHLNDIEANEYPSEFVRALDDPLSIWDKAFRTHIPSRCRHLLFAMFISTEHDAEIEDVEEVFGPLHRTLCSEFSSSFGPKDFEEALRTLEGSFVVIISGRVSFVNPSVRDYLARYLNDRALLQIMSKGVSTLRSARALYDHFKRVKGVSEADRARFLSSYISLCHQAKDESTWKAIPSQPGRYRLYGLSYTDRIDLLRSWWKISGCTEFLIAAEQIASSRSIWFQPWLDGRRLPKLIASLRGAPKRKQKDTMVLVEALEERLSTMLYSDLALDDVQRIHESVAPRKGHLPSRTDSQVAEAARRAIINIPSKIDHIDSESELEDYVKLVEDLGLLFGAMPTEIQSAKIAISKRIDRIREESPNSDDPVGFDKSPQDLDIFDDRDLRNFFEPLITPHD